MITLFVGGIAAVIVISAKAHDCRNQPQASLLLDSSNLSLCHNMIWVIAGQSRRNQNLLQRKQLKDIMSVKA
ncbi:hypothetical protein ACFX19_044692 [Malus domestica]